VVSKLADTAGFNEISTCSAPLASESGEAISELTATVKEQQTQIAAQAEQIKQQKTQIEPLKQIVCRQAGNEAVGKQ
jgi:hypothetical protein